MRLLLDEDLSAERLLAGRPSGEGEASFQRWLKARSLRRPLRDKCTACPGYPRPVFAGR
jgi:hypothetical protein